MAKWRISPSIAPIHPHNRTLFRVGQTIQLLISSSEVWMRRVSLCWQSLLLATRHSSSSCLKNTVTLSKSNRAALVSSSMVRSSFCRRRERMLRSGTRKSVLIVIRQLHGEKAIKTQKTSQQWKQLGHLHSDINLKFHPVRLLVQTGAAWENLSSPGVGQAWTGSVAAHQWQISAPATCGWSPCHLPGIHQRCWTATATPPTTAPPVCTGRPLLPGRRSHPAAAGETCLVFGGWRGREVWCQRMMEGVHLPHYSCPGVAPVHIFYSISPVPLRGYLPLTSTICHCAQFKVTRASCADTNPYSCINTE